MCAPRCPRGRGHSDAAAATAGDFGPSDVTFEVAARPAVGKSGDSLYAGGDTLTLEFNQATNMNGYTTDSLLGKAAVDAMPVFSRSIGADYSAQWASRSSLIISISDPAGAAQPLPDFLAIAFAPASNLRNHPPQCAPLRPDQPSTLQLRAPCHPAHLPHQSPPTRASHAPEPPGPEPCTGRALPLSAT
eukprot:3030-Rhodomonas_salina.1